MELKEFISKVILDIVEAVDESGEKSKRNLLLQGNDSNRTIEFDIAVSAENTNTATGKAGIKVLEFAEAGGNIEKENKNSTVTRIKFGISVSAWTKDESKRAEQKMLNQFNHNQYE